MLFMTAGLSAQTSAKPVIRHAVAEEKGSKVMGVSDNAQWAVARNSGEDGSTTAPRLLNVKTNKFTNLFTSAEDHGDACDVTNDGKYVAGQVNDRAAIYDVEAGSWIKLPHPSGKSFNITYASAITPDGKYAVGSGWKVSADGYKESPMYWDLTGTSPKLVTLTGLPEIDTNGEKASMVRFNQVSPDGRYVFGIVDFSYPMTMWGFLYDTKTSKWDAVGMTYENGTITAAEPGMTAETMCFSPDGKLAAVQMYTDEGGILAYYDLATGNLTYIPDSEAKLLGAIDNNGVVYASAPDTPVRNWLFYLDGYWYDYKIALKQLWDIDWQKDITKDDLGLSGTALGVSDDGLTVVASELSGTPGGAYINTFPKPLKDYSAQLDPLYNNYVFPASGSTFSAVRNVTVYFDRNIKVIGERNSVKLLDEAGNQVAQSIQVALEAGQTRNVVATFRNAEMETGKTYTVVFPAGTVQVEGDANKQNKEIRVSYVGRADTPVKPVKVSPESGTAMPKLSMSEAPIIIRFDAVINSVDNGGGIGLWRQGNDGTYEFLYSLNANIEGTEMNVFPISEQKLAKDVRYKVILEAGTVTDIAGNNPNEKYEIDYVGTYEPEVSIENGVIFQEDFNNYGITRMMLYDGDQRTPSATMENWGFLSTYPWWTARDSEDVMEQAAVSHSMYTPAGKSDDWMVVPQCYIPDASCTLQFDAQSYKKNKSDYLKVYVLATGDVYTAPITKSFIDRFKTEGEMIFNERQTPGASEETLEGEWASYTLPLDKYAGKEIYIAFVNDNEDQSAVFVDNIAVLRDLQFTVGTDLAGYFVDADSTPVKAVFTVLGSKTYDNVDLYLYDEDGNVVDSHSATGLNLKKDGKYEYTFTKPLKLAKGRANYGAIEAKVGDESVTKALTVINLRFEPKRTVVIEEGTGTTCGYCPLGLRGLELMEEIYGDKVIPVGIPSYGNGAAFGNDWVSGYGQFLGFNAYPAGVLNREVAATPLYSDGVNYFKNDPNKKSTWFDYMDVLMSQLTEAEVGIKEATIDPNNKLIEVKMNMRYAYDNDNTNLNVHTVVVENGLKAKQHSYISSNTSPLLGEWASGGKYGSTLNEYTFNHVARGMMGTVYAGVSGMFPRQIDSSKTYDKVYSFPIPTALTSNENAEVVVMLIDSNSGRIINAAKAPCLVGYVGVEDVDFDAMPATGDVYSITGTIVLRNATVDDLDRLDKGVYIFNGKKIMVR